jgi:predicted phage terminase large subunit-like protein
LTREAAIAILLNEPVKVGYAVGFDKLTALHNRWITEMIRGTQDKTLQAHRGSYKTTCVSVALACIFVLLPNKKTLFLRKTDADVKEVIRQVRNILLSPPMQEAARLIHGKDMVLTTQTASELSSNLPGDSKGTSQIVAMGINGSITGKHFDRIFTDDIVNVQDRTSKAERDRTKIVYQELQNIRNRGGRIFNTGTPWHKEDCFSLMPNIERHDCYSTGLISKEQLQIIREAMTASLFAANYELRHIASDDVIFTSPQTGADPALAEQGICHIDASYGGEDGTAFTICKKSGGKYYIYGRLWQKHVDDCLPEIIRLRKAFNAGLIYCERNSDKGYLAKTLRDKGERADTYHEKTNKFVKITSYLKSEWKNVVFVAGTDAEYINQICDYTENAEHDDAPDSAASIVRKLWNKKDTEYVPLWM